MGVIQKDALTTVKPAGGIIGNNTIVPSCTFKYVLDRVNLGISYFFNRRKIELYAIATSISTTRGIPMYVNIYIYIYRVDDLREQT